jgi:hypothetical protein
LGTVLLFTVINALSFPMSSPLSRNASPGLNRDTFEAVVESSQFLTRHASAPSENQLIFSYGEHLAGSGGRDIFLS